MWLQITLCDGGVGCTGHVPRWQQFCMTSAMQQPNSAVNMPLQLIFKMCYVNLQALIYSHIDVELYFLPLHLTGLDYLFLWTGGRLNMSAKKRKALLAAEAAEKLQIAYEAERHGEDPSIE